VSGTAGTLLDTAPFTCVYRISDMTWNFRIVKSIDSANRVSFRIHEVYYQEEKIVTVSETPATPAGECVLDLEGEIRAMLEAFDKPVLNYKDL
jgi:hypothetical protein